MAAYHYTACNSQGQERTGLIEADSARHARSLLREKGLLPLKVDSVAGKKADQARQDKTHALPKSELLLFTQQLASLLDAGLTLERALLAVSEQVENPKTKIVVLRLRGDILEGRSFAQALQTMPKVFAPIYTSLVNAGEQSGNLGQVMAKLAEYLDKRANMSQKVTLALAYPAVVTVVALLVIVALMTYVVPQVVTVFAQTKQTLPFLTRALVAASHFLSHWWWLLLLVIGGGSYGSYSLMKQPTIQRKVHIRLLKTPILGRLARSVNTARMASTLAILVGSGVPLLTALETAKGLVNLAPMKDAIISAIEKVREGVPLSRALGAGKQFPPVLIHLIASGESSGTLASMLERAAAQQQQEVERRVATFTTLMEPLLILVMGGIVLMIVLAIMMPIIDMNQIVR